MLSKVSLKNFKSFEALELPLAPLSILTGANCAGKSTVLQALLLLRQSAVVGELKNGRLLLNGHLVHIGTGRDLIYSEATEDVIGIGLHDDGGQQLEYHFEYDRDGGALQSQVFSANASTVLLHYLSNSIWHYVGAERIGPRRYSHTSDSDVILQRKIDPTGEHVLHYLQHYREQPVCAELCLAYEPSSGDTSIPVSQMTLKMQTERWLNYISPGLRLKIAEERGMDLLQMKFQFEGQHTTTPDFRATNVGFGLSYVLPILVSVLSSRPGDLVILENPEAHLHPSAQAWIGVLLWRAANAGVQVIVETHSDHLLNAVRVEVHDGPAGANNCQIHFFHRDEGDRLKFRVTSPQLNARGKLDRWPVGFFDQWDKAVARLITPPKRT